MPNLVTRPGKDPLKRYGWAVLGFLLMAGGGGVLTVMQRQGGSASDRQFAPGEQSLDSLADSAAANIPAPGSPLPADGAGGAYATKTGDISNPESMLYQSPDAISRGSPISAQEAAALKNGKSGNSLAQALSQVARA